MEKEKIKNGFIIAVIAVITTLGFNVGSDYTINQAISELDGFYICDSTQQVLEFVRISSTKVTGYPYQESNVGRVICEDSDGVNGQWRTLQNYANDNNIDPYDILIQPVQEEPSGWGQQYLCSNVECKLINQNG